MKGQKDGDERKSFVGIFIDMKRFGEASKGIEGSAGRVGRLSKGADSGRGQPSEFEALIKMDPKAHVARLFPIIVVKKFEDFDEELKR